MTYLAVHRLACVCVDCITGETVPAESATRNEWAEILSGYIENESGWSRQDILDHCAMHWVG